MSKQNRNPGNQRQQPQQGTGAGSRRMEQQTAGGSMRPSQQDQGRPPTSSYMEQQGGVGHQQERGRGGANEMPEQAGGQMGQQAGGARQQGNIDFETDWDEEEYQPEQQEGESPQGDDPDFRTKPGGMQHEQQGGAGAQPGSTGVGDAEARRAGGRQARKNSERDRGDPENR